MLQTLFQDSQRTSSKVLKVATNKGHLTRRVPNPSFSKPQWWALIAVGDRNTTAMKRVRISCVARVRDFHGRCTRRWKKDLISTTGSQSNDLIETAVKSQYRLQENDFKRRFGGDEFKWTPTDDNLLLCLSTVTMIHSHSVCLPLLP